MKKLIFILTLFITSNLFAQVNTGNKVYTKVGGGGSTDTSHLSDRINSKQDIIANLGDTSKYLKNTDTTTVNIYNLGAGQTTLRGDSTHLYSANISGAGTVTVSKGSDSGIVITGAGGIGGISKLGTGYLLTKINDSTYNVDSAGVSALYPRRKDSTVAFTTPYQSSLKQDKKVPLGTIINDDFTSSGTFSNYTNTGSATFSNTSSTLQVSGGDGTLGLTNYYTRSWNTALNKYQLSIKFRSTVDGAGIAIGFYQTLAGFIDLSSGASRGQLKLLSAPSTALVTSATNLSFTTGDTISLTLQRYKSTLTLIATNVTTGSSTVTLVYNIPAGSVYIPQNTQSKFSIFAIGGTQAIYNLVYSSTASKNADILVLGDSNGEGYLNAYSQSWAMLLEAQSKYNVEQESRAGFQSTNLTACIPEIKLFSTSVKIILEIGTNDASLGVAATIQANYTNLIDSLVSNGFTPILCETIPRADNSTFIDSLNNYIIRTYTGIYTIINTNTPFLDGTASHLMLPYYGSLHMNSVGHAEFAYQVQSKLDSLNILQFDENNYKNKITTSNPVAATGFTISKPVASAAINIIGINFAQSLNNAGSGATAVQINPTFIGSTNNNYGLVVLSSAVSFYTSGNLAKEMLSVNNGTYTGAISIFRSNNTNGDAFVTIQNDGYPVSPSNTASLNLFVKKNSSFLSGTTLRSSLSDTTTGLQKSRFQILGYTLGSQSTLFDFNGDKLGIGISPTAFLHIKAGTAAAGTAPLKYTAGVLLTTPESGANETDATNNKYYTNSSGIRAREGMWAYKAVTTTYTATDGDYTIDCTGGGTFTVTLPASIAGRPYTITNSGTGTITIATTSSQTFTNVATTPTTLSIVSYGTYQVQGTGSAFIVISKL